MKRGLLISVLAFTFISCQQQVSSRDVLLPVETVSFPALVQAGQDLPITLKVGIGSCRVFKAITADRSPDELRLTVLGTETTSVSTVCTLELRFENRTFVDAGSGPSRGNSFRIMVNRKTWGTVQVVPPSL